LYLASKKVPSINYAVKNFLEFARITLAWLFKYFMYIIYYDLR
jgi:hypothetical protein